MSIVLAHVDFNSVARAINLEDPVDPQDAVTRAWALANLAANPLDLDQVATSGYSFNGSQTLADIPLMIRANCSAGAAGGGDVTVILSSPLKIRVWDVWTKTTTAIASSSVTLRSSSGGLGTALSSAMSTGAVGTTRDTLGNSGDYFQVAAGASLFARFTNRAVACTICMLAHKL
jgi:hypothetical protein